MAPLADAVGFVDGDQAGGGVAEDRPQGSEGETLGRQVEQGEAAADEVSNHLPPFRISQESMQSGRGDAAGSEPVDLILHQADQGTQHHHRPLLHQGRQLVAHGLAASGGKHQQGVPSLKGGGDRFPLERAEVLVSPVFGEEGTGTGEGGLEPDVRRGGHHVDLPWLAISRAIRSCRVMALLTCPRGRSLHRTLKLHRRPSGAVTNPLRALTPLM